MTLKYHRDVSPILVVGVYAAAAAIWLGVTMWATSSDCGPHTVDGQCGMSSFFGTVYGYVAALLLVGIARAVGVSPDSPFHRPRRVSSAGLIALAGGLIAIDAYVVAGSLITGAAPGREVSAIILPTFLVTAFFGAPFAFTIVVVVVVASYWRIDRFGGVTVPWVCGVGAGAGLLLGLIAPRAMAFGFRDRWWMISAGLLLGIVVGWVLWLAGFRHRPLIAATDTHIRARDAM